MNSAEEPRIANNAVEMAMSDPAGSVNQDEGAYLSYVRSQNVRDLKLYIILMIKGIASPYN